jgi:hypothetical protein
MGRSGQGDWRKQAKVAEKHRSETHPDQTARPNAKNGKIGKSILGRFFVGKWSATNGNDVRIGSIFRGRQPQREIDLHERALTCHNRQDSMIPICRRGRCFSHP